MYKRSTIQSKGNKFKNSSYNRNTIYRSVDIFQIRQENSKTAKTTSDLFTIIHKKTKKHIRLNLRRNETVAAKDAHRTLKHDCYSSSYLWPFCRSRCRVLDLYPWLFLEEVVMEEDERSREVMAFLFFLVKMRKKKNLYISFFFLFIKQKYLRRWIYTTWVGFPFLQPLISLFSTHQVIFFHLSPRPFFILFLFWPFPFSLRGTQAGFSYIFFTSSPKFSLFKSFFLLVLYI